MVNSSNALSVLAGSVRLRWAAGLTGEIGDRCDDTVNPSVQYWARGQSSPFTIYSALQHKLWVKKGRMWSEIKSRNDSDNFLLDDLCTGWPLALFLLFFFLGCWGQIFFRSCGLKCWMLVDWANYVDAQLDMDRHKQMDSNADLICRLTVFIYRVQKADLWQLKEFQLVGSWLQKR